MLLKKTYFTLWNPMYLHMLNLLWYHFGPKITIKKYAQSVFQVSFIQP